MISCRKYCCVILISVFAILPAGCGNATSDEEPSTEITITAEPSSQNSQAESSGSEVESTSEIDGTVAEPTHHYFHRKEQPHAAEWGYKGETGPEHWGDLSPGYVLAKSGRRQSPIDIRNATEDVLLPIEFDYRPSKIDLVYNGHTVKEMEEQGSCLVVNGTRFSLEQFHFHSPSEHTVNGKQFAMEMHLVHKSEDGKIAVVGVLIDEGADNAAFDQIWQYLPTAENRERKAGATIDPTTLLPGRRDYYGYSGSFTTPPCTEDVFWMVLQAPVELSASQIQTFRNIIDGNNRPVQPLNGRSVAGSVRE